MGISRACFGVGFGALVLGIAILVNGNPNNVVLGGVLACFGLALGAVGIATRKAV